MITAVIVEDSRLARKELKELLKAHPEIEVVAEADSAEQALSVISAEEPDLLFLDIHLPGRNGFDILRELDKVPLVIFTTAFDQYALQAFEYNTIDYLLKPVVPEQLQRAISKAKEQLKQQPNPGSKKEKMTSADRIFVKDGAKCWFVTLEEIRLFESKGNYTQIHFENNSPLILKSLQQIDLVLDQQQYIRINRQQIVNTRFISNVNEWFGGKLKLTLSTGEIVDVSRRQANRIKELFTL
ncbi:LytR/AlgR family response regulator transcription factor [Pedobacter nutrimenti]|uniref:LytR/AlgR family response regulator transcription factor n=1 Tax=Pedobacter nutrimenti TaxID=1241337 RepID=UPI002930443C|nr:response regulator [Pedobacter nutrimenti]